MDSEVRLALRQVSVCPQKNKQTKNTTPPDLSLMLLYLFFLYSAATILHIELSSVTRCGI